MAKDETVAAPLLPVSESISQVVLAILDTINAAKQVLIEKENFKKFSEYLEKIKFIMKELPNMGVMDGSECLKNAMDTINREVKVAKQLAHVCQNKNRFYLLINCRKVVKRLETCTKEISQALTLIPLGSLDGSLRLNNKISKLCKKMMDAEFRASMVEEEILEKIEFGIQERSVDRSYVNALLVRIAEATGVSSEQSSLKKEFEEFKSEIENAKHRVDMDEALQMEQIIALLEKGDATTSGEEKEKRYLNKRDSLGRQPREPLQSFYCPLTHDVMVDPVETSSGKTFERSAIERWFAEGKNSCPLTLTPLDTSVLWPNKTLRQSIEEWKDMNNIITIVSIKSKLQLNEDQGGVIENLGKLQGLCTERELHREWVVMEEYIPILVGLLQFKNREVRTCALDILCILAKDSDDNKGRIAKADHALEFIVRSLARQIGESRLALQLLLQLSRINEVRDVIGTVQGCIFLTVTISNSTDPQASRDAQELLENLSFLEENIILMAKATFFKPLLQHLSSGPDDVKMIMAKTLSEIELTDHHKLRLFKDGALGQLLQLLSHGDIEMKTIAVKAFQNLSKLPDNGLQMIREGAVGPLFELLYRHSISSPGLREQVAVVVMYLAEATAGQEAHHEQISLLESEEDIFKLFSLISLTGPDIQTNILRTFQAMCRSHSGPDIREKLRQLSAMQVLVQLCELDNQTVRANAVKLFCCLAEDVDESIFLEHVGQKCIETLLRIIKTSKDLEETAAAMGIISNLPKEPKMTQWLMDAGVLQIIFDCLNDENKYAPYKRQVVENAVKSLCRFTASTNQEWQKRVATAGIIPMLVQLLVSGTALTKQYAATSLKQFSVSSSALSKPVKKHRIFQCCFSSPETGCPAHLGLCTVESSFCLVEANAIEPLVRMLGETDVGACEASLEALLTLIDGERLQSGCKVLAESNAIVPIIKLLSSPCARLQEKALRALERVFRLIEFKQKHGNSAQLPLVDITQRGNGDMKSLAAKVLGQLNVLGEQSSYF